jgi:hypothetical protein
MRAKRWSGKHFELILLDSAIRLSGITPFTLNASGTLPTENAQPGQHHGKYNPDPFRPRTSQSSAMAAFWEQAII